MSKSALRAALLIVLSLILPLTLSLLPGCSPQKQLLPAGEAKVVRVIDGDTIEACAGTFPHRRCFKVRYIGIDTPERGEPFYREATEANRKLVLGKEVWLERDIEDRDVYGRALRYVYVLKDGRKEVFVNAWLVKYGYARAYIIKPNTKYASYLLELEEEARREKRGIWGIYEMAEVSGG